MKILIIGWRGAEKHFLKHFSHLPGLAPLVQIVGNSEAGTLETASNLESVGLDGSRIDRLTDGFSGYLTGDHLEQFLTAPVR
jgi:hypothetical protein